MKNRLLESSVEFFICTVVFIIIASAVYTAYTAKTTEQATITRKQAVCTGKDCTTEYVIDFTSSGTEKNHTCTTNWFVFRKVAEGEERTVAYTDTLFACYLWDVN